MVRRSLKLFTFLTCKKGESWLICLTFFSGGSDFCPLQVLLIINRHHWKSAFASHSSDIPTTFSLLVYMHAGCELVSQASPQGLILIISHCSQLLDYHCHGECIWNVILECGEHFSTWWCPKRTNCVPWTRIATPENLWLYQLMVYLRQYKHKDAPVTCSKMENTGPFCKWEPEFSQC